jgi:hypothetical protein
MAEPKVLAFFTSSVAGKVWSGRIKRLRVYDQPDSTGKRVFAYLDPGANENYVGNSQDPNVIRALFSACDNGRVVSGYTNTEFTVEWLDYGGP